MAGERGDPGNITLTTKMCHIRDIVSLFMKFGGSHWVFPHAIGRPVPFRYVSLTVVLSRLLSSRCQLYKCKIKLLSFM